MKKLLAAIVAGMFVLSTAPIAFAMKHEMENPVTKACKDKKPGEEVTVDGKKVKCPAPKPAA